MRLNAREIAFMSVMVALLIGGQALFAAVPGVEVVTVLLLCFSRAFGPGRGALTATAYSLLRCFFFGFDAKTVVLYLLYFNFFACLFGFSGLFAERREGQKAAGGEIKAAERKRKFPWNAAAADLLFLLLCALAIVVLLDVPKVSVLLRAGLKTMAWVLLSVAVAGGVAFNVLSALGKKYPVCSKAAEAAFCAAAAAVCTVLFTLLDDLLYPLFYGVSGEAAIAYFYASFTAMLPQTVCAVVSICVLFFPLMKFFSLAASRCRRQTER